MRNTLTHLMVSDTFYFIVDDTVFYPKYDKPYCPLTMASIQTLNCKVVLWCSRLLFAVERREFCLNSTCCVDFMKIVLSFYCQQYAIYQDQLIIIYYLYKKFYLKVIIHFSPPEM